MFEDVWFRRENLEIGDFKKRSWKSMVDIVIFILNAKISDVWKISCLYCINDKFWEVWELLFILIIVIQNVDLVLIWLICWKCSKYGICAIPWMNWNKMYLFILWNCIEWRNENFDHNGSIVWKNWKWKNYCIVLIIVALAYQFIWLHWTLKVDFENLHWEKNVEKQVFMGWFWGKYNGKSWKVL